MSVFRFGKIFMRIISINLNGIRSAASKGFFPWMQHQQADIVCVQELKAQAADMTPEMLAPAGYNGHFHYAEKKGYSGVGIYSRREPDAMIEGLGIAEFDAEGRYLEAQFGNISVVSLYLPSGSSGEERQAVKFRFMAAFMPHLVELRKSRREVILCGDRKIALGLPKYSTKLDSWTCSANCTRSWKPTPGGLTAARHGQKMWAGALT